jgi:hypothetical protein
LHHEDSYLARQGETWKAYTILTRKPVGKIITWKRKKEMG